MKKHLTSRMTCILLLLAMLTSCGGSDTPDTSTENSPADTTTSPSAETEKEYPAELSDYDGYTFTFLNQEDDFWTGANHILDYDGITGDSLSDAVYNRNRNVEEELNVRFEVLKGDLDTDSNMRSLMNQSIAAQEDIYDIVYTPLYFNGATSFDGQSTINLYDVQNLHLDREWWNQSFIQSATIGKDILYTSIDYVNLMGYCYCNILYFNKEICDNNSLEYPYEDVQNGTWTYYKMFEMMSVAANIGTQTDWSPDLSGDAIYGFTSMHQEATIATLLGSGIQLLSKNSSGVPQINTNLDRLIDAYDILLNHFSQGGNCLLTNKPGTTAGQGLDYFLNGRALFFSWKLGGGASGRFRESETVYGILPTPKMDTQQEVYCSPLSEKALGINIPLTASDPERTGAIMDYLAYVSYQDVLPVLQNTLCYRGLQDPMDIEMMDIILETEQLDIGMVYGWTADFLNDVCGESKMLKGNNTFTSSWNSQVKKIQENIDKQFSE